MSHLSAAALGAIAGGTIFIGLPVGRIRGISKAAQGLLNAIATGVLIFLFWDILSHASAPVETALAAMHRGDHGFVIQVAIFAFGIGAGLLSLVYVNARLFGRTKNAPPAAPRTLAMMIATGLGFHNLSEGLAIGQSAATGAIAFAIVLVIGFPLYTVLLTSLSPQQAITQAGGLVVIPDGLTLAAYQEILSGGVVTRSVCRSISPSLANVTRPWYSLLIASNSGSKILHESLVSEEKSTTTICGALSTFSAKSWPVTSM